MAVKNLRIKAGNNLARQLADCPRDFAAGSLERIESSLT